MYFIWVNSKDIEHCIIVYKAARNVIFSYELTLFTIISQSEQWHYELHDMLQFTFRLVTIPQVKCLHTERSLGTMISTVDMLY